MVAEEGVITATGSGLTITVTLSESVHPLPSVTTTVYVVLAAGLTVIACVIAIFDQE